MIPHFATTLAATQRAFNSPTFNAAVQETAAVCERALRVGGKIMLCGNGGSAADAQHLAAEFVGRYKKDRPALAAIALTTDTSVLTAVANDFDFDQIFSRHVGALGHKGDVLIGITTSGLSLNVINAARLAHRMEMTTIAFTGLTGLLGGMPDIEVRVPSLDTAIIQQLHMIAGHAICDIIEQKMYP